MCGDPAPYRVLRRALIVESPNPEFIQFTIHAHSVPLVAAG